MCKAPVKFPQPSKTQCFSGTAIAANIASVKEVALKNDKEFQSIDGSQGFQVVIQFDEVGWEDTVKEEKNVSKSPEDSVWAIRDTDFDGDYEQDELEISFDTEQKLEAKDEYDSDTELIELGDSTNGDTLCNAHDSMISDVTQPNDVAINELDYSSVEAEYADKLAIIAQEDCVEKVEPVLPPQTRILQRKSHNLRDLQAEKVRSNLRKSLPEVLLDARKNSYTGLVQSIDWDSLSFDCFVDEFIDDSQVTRSSWAAPRKLKQLFRKLLPRSRRRTVESATA